MAKRKDTQEAETRGIRLLKKGQRGIIKMIFGRMGLILLLLLINFGILLLAFLWFEEFLPQFYGSNIILAVCMVLYLINSRIDPTAKITWLIIIMLLPVFGSLLCLFARAELGHRTMGKMLQKIYAKSKALNEKNDSLEKLYQKSFGAGAMASYVSSFTGIPVFSSTDAEYLKSGECTFERMLAELERAEKSIYLEYFIIDEGIMWGQILEVLARKAKDGVDVRVIYDGTCELLLLPKGYPKQLKKLGIKCRVFSPATPFVSTHYNYRDHRKILTIDGRVAFTGGVNLADEYINKRKLHGHWKDSAVILSGDAAKGFEHMFLQMWNLNEKNPVFPEWENTPSDPSGSFAMPYYEDPLDDEHIGRQVYIDILNRAGKYVNIMTPYLILDGELECALTYAAKRGVDVRLILPGIPDKKIPYALAKGHYPALVSAGVKIYEYTPGFVHAKSVTSDGKEAVIGSINFDYRSLYHHFECAVYMYGYDCIADIDSDFNECIEKSKRITRETIKKERLYYKLLGKVMKIVAPLM